MSMQFIKPFKSPDQIEGCFVGIVFDALDVQYHFSKGRLIDVYSWLLDFVKIFYST